MAFKPSTEYGKRYEFTITEGVRAHSYCAEIKNELKPC